MKVNVTIRDYGISFDVISRNSRRLGNRRIKAGILRTAGRAGDGKTDLVDVAAYNEFGTKHIPSRPFMRIAANKNEKKWQKLMGDVAARVIVNRMDVRQGMKIIGNQVVGNIQDVIGNRSLLAPNAPNTIKQKGSDAPLIDSGHMRQSVSFEVK